MRILGLNAYHGDSSAALLEAGLLVAAIEEERFNRVKHWAGLPIRSCMHCLGGNYPDHVAISRDPRAHLLDKVGRVVMNPSFWPKLISRASNNVQVSLCSDRLRAAGVIGNDTHFHFVEHHRAHLASAFFASPFEEAAVVSIDGFGDFSSVMWASGQGTFLDIKGSVVFPHSLGLFYTAFTQFLGFPKYGDEYKAMGLAAYGEPRYVDLVRDVVHTADDQIRLNLDYFTHHTNGVDMTWDNGEPTLGRVYSHKMIDVFGTPREKYSELAPRHADLAASMQAVLEERYFALLRYIQKQTGHKAVCLAGGVALNCAANGKIFDETPFRDVYIQPAAHDAGTSIGAALYVAHQVLKQPRQFVMQHVYYGPEYSDAEIQECLGNKNAIYHALSTGETVARAAADIASGNVIGWFQGHMEFGPRALGNRSILADPRRRDMKDILNSRIKHRETFRPFCPSILAERCSEFFETDYPSPFMVTAYKIKPDKRDLIPAVTHADGTGRLQTVDKSINPLYWRLISEFDRITGVPVLLNTSFNENEPIVMTPAEAVDCFFRTRMDVLVIGNNILYKSENEHLSKTRVPFAESIAQ